MSAVGTKCGHAWIKSMTSLKNSQGQIKLSLIFQYWPSCCSLPLQILGVLCQDGILRFVNLGTFVQLFDVGRLDDRVNNFVVSSNGRHVVAVMDSGNVNVYNAQTLVQALNKVFESLATLFSQFWFRLVDEQFKPFIIMRVWWSSVRRSGPPTSRSTASDNLEGHARRYSCAGKASGGLKCWNQ